MPHDNYSTAADEVLHDGTLFPQPYNRPRAAGKLQARASACG
jgi:hypothetical protein